MPDYKIKVKRVDNRLIILLNNQELFNQSHELDPELNTDIDITHRLQPHPFVNKVYFQGHNGHGPGSNNPAHFHYQILKDTEIVVEVDWKSQGNPGQNQMVFENHHEIVKEDDSGNNSGYIK